VRQNAAFSIPNFAGRVHLAKLLTALTGISSPESILTVSSLGFSFAYGVAALLRKGCDKMPQVWHREFYYTARQNKFPNPPRRAL
jgi:hypothetical protein